MRKPKGLASQEASGSKSKLMIALILNSFCLASQEASGSKLEEENKLLKTEMSSLTRG